MALRHEFALDGGRTLDAHDSGLGGFPVIWMHPSPQTGAILEPLVSLGAEREIRMLSYARPSYGASTPSPGRIVADAADDVAAVADEFGLDRFAVIGSSGGATHALACAALLPDRVTGVASFSAIAPMSPDRAHEFDWFDGMVAPGGLRAAMLGRSARVAFAASDEFDDDSFIEADYEALAGDWSALGDEANAANSAGPAGLIDDDMALVSPWGFDLADITVPVLLVQGDADRIAPRTHAEWMATRIRDAELRLIPGGHISVLSESGVAMDWLLEKSLQG
jgi:pimeloyl-ACP methyl ester carboxylesterase